MLISSHVLTHSFKVEFSENAMRDGNWPTMKNKEPNKDAGICRRKMISPNILFLYLVTYRATPAAVELRACGLAYLDTAS